jgi:hypothetical protein
MYAVAVGLQLIILPLFGFEIDLESSIKMGAVYAGIFIVVAFIIRYSFHKLYLFIDNKTLGDKQNEN